MKKIFVSFLFIILFLSFSKSSAQAANVCPINADKCYYCPQMNINGVGYTGTAVNLNQCLSEYKIYPSPNNSNDECTNQDNDYVGNYVCEYNPTNSSDTSSPRYMTLANAPSANGGKCTSSQTCSCSKGCIGASNPDPGRCGIPGDDTKPCDTQFDCKNNDNNCSENWCVNKATGNLFSDNDFNTIGAKGGACRHTTTAPTCPAGQNCDDPTGSAQITPNKPLSKPCTTTSTFDKSGCDSINTALGSIATKPNTFISFLLGLVLSLAGLILLFLLITNGYKLMTSQGDPEKIKDAREGIVAAVTGILLIIFSLAILEFITVNVLGIPGFGH